MQLPLSKAWNFTKNLMGSLKNSLEVFKNSYRNILCSLSKKHLELLRHFKVCQPYTWNRDIKIQRRGRQRERQKTFVLISKTTTSHVLTFLYISFLFLHHYYVKTPNFAIYAGLKQAMATFYFSFWAWLWSLEIQLQGGSPTFDKVSG